MYVRAMVNRGLILFFTALLSIVGNPTATHPQVRPDGTDASWIARGEFLYHGFMSDDMRDAYGSAYGLQTSLLTWFESMPRIGLRGDFAFYAAENGEAAIVDSSWTATKRKLGVLALEVSATVLYRLRQPDSPRKVMPYTGIGLGGVFGFDQLWASIHRSGTTIEGHTALAFRPAFEAHALLGATVPITESLSLVAEALWIQAGDAGHREAGSPTEEERELSDVVYSVLRYPDMNITGWRGLFGVQYQW
jgi:hypothetical protein